MNLDAFNKHIGTAKYLLVDTRTQITTPTYNYTNFNKKNNIKSNTIIVLYIIQINTDLIIN